MTASSVPKRPRLNRLRWQAIRCSRRLRHRLRLGWRKPLARWRARPTFIILGAQKSGTSSLYAYLTTHPQVRAASWKEVHYFDLHYEHDFTWYRSHFPLAARLRRHQALTGEASPYYLAHPRAAERIVEALPDVRLIVLLRNPTARTISHYWHQVKRGRESLPLGQALAVEDQRLQHDETDHKDNVYLGYNHFHFSYKKRSLYAPQLKRYYNYFRKEQVLVVKSEDFFRNVQGTFDRVTEHIGLPSWTLPAAPARNSGGYPPAPPDVKRKLRAFFRPHNQTLYDLLETTDDWW